MAKYFNEKHTSLQDLNMTHAWLKLAKGTKQCYRLPHLSVLDVVKVGSYLVKRKVGKVAFELELPPEMKIHSGISCTHLEPAVTDPLHRKGPPLPLIEMEGKERYLVDRIVKGEMRWQPGDKTRRPYLRVR